MPRTGARRNGYAFLMPSTSPTPNVAGPRIAKYVGYVITNEPPVVTPRRRGLLIAFIASAIAMIGVVWGVLWLLRRAFVPLLAVCLIAGCPPATTPTGTPTTQPASPQSTLNAIVADEQFAYAVAAVMLSGQNLADLNAANTLFQAAAATVQSEISTGSVTAAQVTALLIDAVTAVKTISAKVPAATAPAK